MALPCVGHCVPGRLLQPYGAALIVGEWKWRLTRPLNSFLCWFKLHMTAGHEAEGSGDRSPASAVSDAAQICFFWEPGSDPPGSSPTDSAVPCKALNLPAISSRRAAQPAFAQFLFLQALLNPCAQWPSADRLTASCERCRSSISKPLFVFFQRCNLVVFKLFSKDLWEQ